jgi:transcriptional regulator with XRE-family HTH domain
MDRERLTLSAKQASALPQLAAGLSYATVADNLNINPSTISKWLRSPRFAAELAALRRDVYLHTSAAIGAAACDAVAVLRHLATDPEIAPAVRVSAASKLLDASLKGAQLDAQWDPVTLNEIMSRLLALKIKPDDLRDGLMDLWRVADGERM